MPNGVVNRSDFDKITELDAKLGILFETQKETQGFLKETIEKIDIRFEAGNRRFRFLEKLKLRQNLKDKTFAGFMGLIGGFLASFYKGG